MICLTRQKPVYRPRVPLYWTIFSFWKSFPATTMAQLVNKVSKCRVRGITTITCFQHCIILGMFNIAFFLFSSLPFMVRSQSFPFTFCPTPVPLTRKPCSSLLCIRNSVPLVVNGRSSSTPCFLASLTRSACLRNE